MQAKSNGRVAVSTCSATLPPSANPRGGPAHLVHSRLALEVGLAEAHNVVQRDAAGGRQLGARANHFRLHGRLVQSVELRAGKGEERVCCQRRISPHATQRQTQHLPTGQPFSSSPTCAWE